MQVLAGAGDQKERATVRGFLTRFERAPLDDDVGERAVTLRRATLQPIPECPHMGRRPEPGQRFRPRATSGTFLSTIPAFASPRTCRDVGYSSPPGVGIRLAQRMASRLRWRFEPRFRNCRRARWRARGRTPRGVRACMNSSTAKARHWGLRLEPVPSPLFARTPSGER